MAEFKDASLWMKLAFLLVTIAQVVELHGFSSEILDGYNSVRGAIVVGFLCLIVAFILALCLVFLDELNGNKAALICFIIGAWIAGFALIIGVALWGNSYNALSTYPAMLLCVAAILAGIAGIFGILEVVGVKA